jgi:hypothetical protein
MPAARGNPAMGLTKTAVVAGILAGRTRPVKVHLADAANIVLWYVPPPRRDRVPLGDADLHDCGPRTSQSMEYDDSIPRPLILLALIWRGLLPRLFFCLCFWKRRVSVSLGGASTRQHGLATAPGQKSAAAGRFKPKRWPKLPAPTSSKILAKPCAIAHCSQTRPPLISSPRTSHDKPPSPLAAPRPRAKSELP